MINLTPSKPRKYLTIIINPLAVPRGHRRLSCGSIHRTARHPGRARAKRQWQSTTE